MEKEDIILIEKLESVGCVPSAKYRFLFKDQLFYVNDIIVKGTLQVMDRFVVQNKLKDLIVKSNKILKDIQPVYPGLTNEESIGLNKDEYDYKQEGVEIKFISQTPEGEIFYYTEDKESKYPSKHLEKVGFINASNSINKISSILEHNNEKYKL